MKSNYLKAARIRAGKTAQEMADAIGKSRQVYYNKESGLSKITPDEVSAIARFLGLTAEETWTIFFEDEFPKEQREVMLRAFKAASGLSDGTGEDVIRDLLRGQADESVSGAQTENSI